MEKDIEKSEKKCTEHRVSICQIEDKVKAKQVEYMEKTGSYLSVPRAIIQLILEK